MLVTGTVTDKQTGESLAGAHVVETATGQGTTTTSVGSYAINITPGNIIRISYVGYKPAQIKPDNILGGHVAMERDTNLLGEAVVTAKPVSWLRKNWKWMLPLALIVAIGYFKFIKK